MSVALATVILVIVGAQLALQAPINSGLGRFTGLLLAAAVSFAVGTTILFLVALAAGHIGEIRNVTGVEHYMLMGGLLGATFVLTATIVVGTIGAGAVAAATITGQLLASLALDQAGILGLEETPLSLSRAVGAAALIMGTLMIVYNRTGDRPGNGLQGSPLRVALSILAMTAAAALVAVQAPINAQLAGEIGDANASFMSFGTGTIVLAAVVLLTGSAAGLRGIGRARWWQLTGGSMGAINTTAALLLVQTVGAGLLTAATVSGQLVSSVLIDRLGLLGMRRTPLCAARIGGIVLLGVGVALAAG